MTETEPGNTRNGHSLGEIPRLLGDAHAGVIVVDGAARAVFLNDSARAILGPDLEGTNVRHWPVRLGLRLEGETDPCPLDRFPPAIAVKARSSARLERDRPDVAWLAVDGHPVRDEAGRPLGGIVFVRDVSARKRIELALDDEQAYLTILHRRQAALATIQLAISEPHELRPVLEQVVQLVAEHLPATAASIVLWNPETGQFEVSASTVESQDGARTARRVRREGGASRWIVDHVRPLIVEDVAHDPFGANAMLAEERLEAYAGLPLIGEGEVLGVLYALDGQRRTYTDDDIDFLTRLASRAATALGKVQLYEQMRALNHRLNRRTVELAEHRAQLEKLVEKRTADLRSSVERLRVADRLATVGTLTAGLGHDINNILFPIRCRLEALDADSVPPEFRDTLAAMSHATEYLQQLSNGLRQFSRDPDRADTAECTDLRTWWSEIHPLLVKTLPGHVTLEYDVPPDLAPARVAPHRLTQAVLNLVVNAGEAIEDAGTVRVEAAAGAGRVQLRVSDDGHGMTTEVRERIFDPFYTTKTRGMSTGLGLSLVHGVIRSSPGAEIDVDSEPGRGTTFILTFENEATVVSASPEATIAGVALVRMRDPRIGAWAERYLEEAGFVVEPAVEDDADVLVTDLADGYRALANAFLEYGQGRRVIVCGGGEGQPCPPRVTRVASATDLAAIREAILSLRERSSR